VTAVADRVVILVKGEVAFEGAPAALQADRDILHRFLGV
jgi:ABC-type branched-subunit amino acid transport system ATPase component